MDSITYDDLLEYYEDYFKYLDQQLFKQCLEEFFDITGIKYQADTDDYITLYINIKRYFIYESEYVKLWFDILKKHNYTMKSEMRDVINQLTSLRFPNFNKSLIKKLLNSPVVDDISYEKGMFTIESSEYGSIKVMLAKYILQDVRSVMKYMKKYDLSKRCHDSTYFLSNKFLDFHSIVSLCNHYFNHPYYHSYPYDPETDTVFDLTLKAVFESDTFYKIFEPKEIINVKNEDIPEMLRVVESNTKQPERRCHLLKIALPHQLENLSDEEKIKILDYKNRQLIV